VTPVSIFAARVQLGSASAASSLSLYPTLCPRPYYALEVAHASSMCTAKLNIMRDKLST